MTLGLLSGFPRITGVRWFNLSVLTITPLISVYGIANHPLSLSTGIASLLYFLFSMLGE